MSFHIISTTLLSCRDVIVDVIFRKILEFQSAATKNEVCSVKNKT